MSKQKLQSVIMQLVRKRGSSKTICPSEAAQVIASDGNWRELMDDTRDAARKLHRQGKIQIEQQGKPVDPDQYSGPIRLRLKEDSDE